MSRRVAAASVMAALGLVACSSGGTATPPSVTSTAAATPSTAPTGQTRATAATTTSTGSTATAATTLAPTTAFVPAPDALPAVEQLLDAAEPLHRFSLGPDTLGVWICHVALDIDDPIYNEADLRLDLHPDVVAGLLNTYIGPYFRTLSLDQYQPTFVAGGEVSIAKGQTNQDCVDQAKEQAGDDIDGLVVVADAEHASSQPGGWGTPGDACPDGDPCPANRSGRATYIGASDFHPDWGAEPAVDLEEHEIGHSLGFPHSGGGGSYTSVLDLMSNSAAPRDVDPTRRDGPDTLAVNRLAAGWLPLDAVTVGTHGETYQLVSSNAADGPRLVILPLDEHRFVTVELLTNTGFDAHLPESGIAIHLIDQGPSACHSSASVAPCVNEQRMQTTLGSDPPHTDLLTLGESFTVEGWTVTVTADGDSWTIEVG